MDAAFDLNAHGLVTISGPFDSSSEQGACFASWKSRTAWPKPQAIPHATAVDTKLASRTIPINKDVRLQLATHTGRKIALTLTISRCNYFTQFST